MGEDRDQLIRKIDAFITAARQSGDPVAYIMKWLEALEREASEEKENEKPH